MNRPTLDLLLIHSNDLGEPLGDFHGTTIYAWDPQVSEVREQRLRTQRIAYARQVEADRIAEREANDVSL
jgi:hypothetical protein